MGTRHVIAVVLDGQYKIAQYGQWDGYPGGQGADILTFLRSEMDRKLFESKVRALHFNTSEQSLAEWTAAGADPGEEWVTMEVSDVHRQMYPQNSRDTGAGVLKIVQDGAEGMGLQDQLDFIAESLMCEWAYVIDLDRNTFEVFAGFNKTPLSNGERFYFLQKEEVEESASGGKYFPCKTVAIFSLAVLPTEDLFIRACRQSDDEEEQEDLPEGVSGMEPGLITTETDRAVFAYIDSIMAGQPSFAGVMVGIKSEFPQLDGEKINDLMLKYLHQKKEQK